MADGCVLGDEARRATLQTLVLAWFRDAARCLPWRETRDPYAVLVSEFMLQQTQVARVETVYPAFVERFPTVAALADASTDTVVRQWRGLGYNRRAVRLRRAALVIVEHHAGEVPAELASLRALPGVGTYTARAVLAFAFALPVAPVDTNVARVLVRAVAGRPLSARAAQALADAILPDGAPREWGQALMDLGASCCTARRPRCDACPVAAMCAWRLRGRPVDDPAATARRPKRETGFAGSDRFHRGRLVDALRDGPVEAAGLATSAQLDDDGRVAGLVAGLVADGLAEWHDGTLRLPS